MSELNAMSVSWTKIPDKFQIRVSVAISIDDLDKHITSQNIPEEWFIKYTAVDARAMILDSFEYAWELSGVETDMRNTLVEQLDTILKKQYKSESWSTMVGGPHNKTSITFSNGGLIGKATPFSSPVDTTVGTISGQSVDLMATQLPGVLKMVSYPCGCKSASVKDRVYDVIIHLNDRDKWTCDAIADWIDKLHDAGTINAEFSVAVDED